MASKAFKKMDLGDAVAKGPVLGNMAYKARVVRLLKTNRAQQTAINIAKGYSNTCKRIVECRCAAVKGYMFFAFFSERCHKVTGEPRARRQRNNLLKLCHKGTCEPLALSCAPLQNSVTCGWQWHPDSRWACCESAANGCGVLPLFRHHVCPRARGKLSSIRIVRGLVSAHAAMSGARQEMAKLERTCAHKTRLRANCSHGRAVNHGPERAGAMPQ